MKGFASTSFFHVFNNIVRPTDPRSAAYNWTVDGVDWTHTRHASRNADYQFSIDVYLGRTPGKKGWRVMIVRESWWAGGKTDPVKNVQTAHFLSGDRKEALAWFRRQELQTRNANIDVHS